MLVLLEGPNGSGKTSLSQALAEAIPGDVPIYKKSNLTLPALVEFTADIAAYSPGAGFSAVGDRWHLSEMVYGPLLRGRNGLSPIEWACVDQFLARRGALVVIVTADTPILADRLAARGEVVSVVQLETERQAFERAKTWTKLPVCRYNTSSSPDRRKVIPEIIAAARKAEQRAIDEAAI